MSSDIKRGYCRAVDINPGEKEGPSALRRASWSGGFRLFSIVENGRAVKRGIHYLCLHNLHNLFKNRPTFALGRVVSYSHSKENTSHTASGLSAGAGPWMPAEKPRADLRAAVCPAPAGAGFAERSRSAGTLLPYQADQR